MGPLGGSHKSPVLVREVNVRLEQRVAWGSGTPSTGSLKLLLRFCGEHSFKVWASGIFESSAQSVTVGNTEQCCLEVFNTDGNVLLRVYLEVVSAMPKL